ncbi:homeotic protein empty spiracles [Plakobranchus ocellatus]|uniref:Homeotic protein empty spiracles n=1 Tax=Plakobranchus ocellatus TaxID=259542 RepID=A0AAV4B6D2_9GAST|nr:homeotic protein empty spiracles [Plakobranchus ocellatus]
MEVKVWFQNRRTKHKRMKAEEDGSSCSQTEGSDGHGGKNGDGSDLTTYMEHDDDDEPCSDEEEELSVTEDC